MRAVRTACVAGDRDEALQQVDAALAIDPELLPAHWLRKRVLEARERPGGALTAHLVPSAPTPSVAAEMRVKHPLVSAEALARFELDARRHRLERCLDAARAALEQRRLEEADEVLYELSYLDPDLPELRELTAEFDALSRIPPSTHGGPWIIAAVVFVIIAAGVLIRTALGLGPQDPGSLFSTAGAGSTLVVEPPKPAAAVMASSAIPVTTAGERERPVEAPPASPLERGTSPAEKDKVEAPPASPLDRRTIRAEKAEVRPPRLAFGTGRAENDKVEPSLPLPLERKTSQKDKVEAVAPSPLDRRTSQKDKVEAVPPSPLDRIRTIRADKAEAQAPPPPALELGSSDVVNPGRDRVRAEKVEPPPLQAALPRLALELPAVAATAPRAASAATAVVNSVDDEWLVRQTLQRYRKAYEGLDAQAAQAVYPAVNQAALARAFGGLRAQSLAFDSCDTQVHGGSATATCRGSARYVPKIGSPELHTEPRIWSFTLMKNGGVWKIENARAER